METIKKNKKYILVAIICVALVLVFIPKNSNSDSIIIEGDKSKVEKTEKQKERLVIGVYAPLEHSQIYLGEDQGSRLATKLVYESLVKINKDLSIDYQIASHIKFSKDGKKATIQINKKTFSDGSILNSQAIKDSYQELNSYESEYYNKSYTTNIVGMSDYQQGYTKDIKGIKVIDDKTLEFDFRDCRSENICALSLPVINVEDSCGSGSYIVKKYRFGKDICLKRTNQDEKLSYKEVIIKGINTDNMERQMKDFNLDVLEVGEGHFKTIKKLGYHNVYQLNKDNLTYLDFNLNSSSGKNKKIREAVYYGFNKHDLKKSMNKNNVFIGHYMTTSLKDNQDVYNLSKAKSAKQETKITNIDFDMNGDANSLLTYQSIQKSLKKVVLNISQGSSFASIKTTHLDSQYGIEKKILQSSLKKDYQKKVKETYQKDCLDILKELDSYILDEYLVLPLYTSTYNLAIASDVQQDEVLELMTQ